MILSPAELAELTQLFRAEPPTQELKPVKRERMPAHVHWSIASTVTLLAVIGFAVIVKAIAEAVSG